MKTSCTCHSYPPVEFLFNRGVGWFAGTFGDTFFGFENEVSTGFGSTE